MAWVLCFLFLVPVIFIISMRISTMLAYTHLAGFWYLDKQIDQIGQWFELVTNFQDVKKLCKGIPVNPMRSMVKAFMQLELKHVYIIETHLKDALEKYETKGRLKIHRCEFHKKRFLFELVQFRGIQYYLRKRLSRNAKDNNEIHKEFYIICFTRLR